MQKVRNMISIIVPIYNASKYLNECFQSICSQEYTDFEVLCIDDGSVDGSAEIVRKYMELDKRFKLYQQLNAGVSVARNLGLKHAQGNFICFVDADDMISSNYLSVLYSFCKEGNFAICSFTRKLEHLGQFKNKVSKYSAKEFIYKVFDESIRTSNLWAMMFKTKIIKDYNIEFYPGCVRNEDTEFYMKYLAHEEGDIVVTNYKGYFYRDNPNSVMHTTKRNAFTSFEASERLEKYLADNGIQMQYNKMLYGSVQGYSVGLAREKNIELYEELHNLYNIKKIMYTLLTKHSRLLRRLIAFAYIILGKNTFYKMLSIVGKR